MPTKALRQYPYFSDCGWWIPVFDDAWCCGLCVFSSVQWRHWVCFVFVKSPLHLCSYYHPYYGQFFSAPCWIDFKPLLDQNYPKRDGHYSEDF